MLQEGHPSSTVSLIITRPNLSNMNPYTNNITIYRYYHNNITIYHISNHQPEKNTYEP